MNQIEKKQPVGILNNNTPYNEFYYSVSVIFRIISFVLFVAFLIFIVSSAFAGAENFSYENLEFIVRNFALKLDENRDASRYSVRYNPDAYRTYSLFGEGIIVCGASQLSIYSATGRLTCSETMIYSEPIMVSSDKFVLVYDNGSGRYTVYNSFTDVFSDELQYPIKGAAISDNGSYALITSSDSYNSVVEVYNSDFQKVNSVNRTDFITCIDISDTHVLVSSVNVDDTNSYKTNLLSCAIGADSPEYSVASYSSVPLACGLYEWGAAVLSSNCIEFFNNNGTDLAMYDFESAKLTFFAIDESGALLIFKDGGFDTQYSAICVSPDGKTKYESNIAETIFDAEYSNSTSYILTEDRIFCIDEKGTYTYPLEDFSDDMKVLAYGERSIYICTNTAAQPIDLFDFKNGD